jgi:hypothetical protein
LPHACDPGPRAWHPWTASTWRFATCTRSRTASTASGISFRGRSSRKDLYPDRAALVRAILRAHVAVATATFVAWFSLAAVSWRRLSRTLPGSFSRLHRLAGRLTFAGECFVAFSPAR